MRRFFKNSLLHRLVYRRRWRCKNLNTNCEF